MGDINAHPVAWVDDKGRGTEWPIAWVFPASRDSVDYVLAQSSDPDDDDGRSNWCWIRLQNGDLILGVYPQGDTYSAVEVDAEFPDDMPSLPIPDHAIDGALDDLDAIMEDSE